MAKLSKLQVTFISLVARPANGKAITLKNDNMRADVFEVKKTDDDLQRVYGIVYAPDQQDSQGDEADAETIRRAADEFMRKARTNNIDAEHGFENVPAFVAESWIIKASDATFPDEKPGAWAVGIQIQDRDLWQDIKRGDYTGLSLAGTAVREDADPQSSYTEKSNQAPNWFTNWVKKHLPKPSEDSKTNQEEAEMDKEEIQSIAKAAVAEALKEAGITKDDSDPKGGDAGGDNGTNNAPAAKGAEVDIAKTLEDAVTGLKSDLTTVIKDEVAAATAKGSLEGGLGDDDDKGSFV